LAIAPGARIGLYEVLSQIGAGGMGEVYLARDTQLGRNVALKVLPDLFASDTERLARFRREAQVLAALHHPNIAVIYGEGLRSGMQGSPYRTYDISRDGLRFLVLKLVATPERRSARPNMIVIQNFAEELKRRVPVK